MYILTYYYAAPVTQTSLRLVVIRSVEFLALTYLSSPSSLVSIGLSLLLWGTYLLELKTTSHLFDRFILYVSHSTKKERLTVVGVVTGFSLGALVVPLRALPGTTRQRVNVNGPLYYVGQ